MTAVASPRIMIRNPQIGDFTTGGHPSANSHFDRSASLRIYSEAPGMEARDVNTWEEFLSGLDDFRKERAASTDYVPESPLLFRGQGKACWQLGATLERVRERMLFSDYYRLIDKIRPQLESLTGKEWPIPSRREIEELLRNYDSFSLELSTRELPAYAYMAHLRHHGFPSPLLDWTRSPYIAAYFAFANACTEIDGRVSIFVLSKRNFTISGNQMDIVHICGSNVTTHRRHVLQQS